MIFDLISLDYHETLMAVSGEAAEAAMARAMAANKGKYVVVVDGSVSTADGGVYSTNAGKSNLETLKEVTANAAAVLSVGTCAAFGGIPHARPNPTGAVPVSEIVTDKPVVNIPGCPPIPEAIAGTVAYFVTFGKLPDLDHLNRPKSFFGDTIHDRCYRRPFYDKGLFAKSFDDEGARNGWCLYEVGCKGPVTYNACATLKWNGGVSFPIQSGHGCLGCSEPDFWDRGSFYKPLSASVMGNRAILGGAAVAGVAAGGASALLARRRRAEAARTMADAAAAAAQKEMTPMSLLDFARGPALDVAMAVFLLGVGWRLVSLLALPWARDRSRKRAGTPPAFVGAAGTLVRHLWVPKGFGLTSRFALINGYVFHIGLAIIVFGFAQHILFLRGLFGLGWPGLPTGIITVAAVVTLASLVAALVRRMTSPVLRLISTFNDWFTWAITFLPVLTGLLAVSHLGARYETLLAIHMLSVAALLIWFPFGKLMHAFLVFLTRSETGAFYSRRGVKI